MRTSVVPTLARWLSPLVALSVLGCPKQELAPLGPCTVSAVSERVDQSGVSDVDLLFVIDNSSSMASEQLKLAAQLPNLVRVLTSGDRYPGVPDDMLPAGVTPETRKFTPVKTLHLGVVSTNAGGIDDVTPSSGEKLFSCLGEGDDGKLQNSTEIAITGVRAAKDEFPGYAKDEWVLEPRPACADLMMPPAYQEFEAGTTDSPATTAEAFSCVSALGVRGCPFEQQLESMWKALAPSQGIGDPALFTFINGTRGQGDRYNKGFLRDEAILAVLIVTDEEDCSITDAGKVLFPLAGRDLNVRCGFAADDTDLVQSPQRYIAGLKSLKPANPDRIVFGVIGGIPVDAITSQQSIEEILARDDMKFRSMINPTDTQMNEFPVPSCTTTTNGKTDQAYPPRRMLQVAQGFPEQSVIYSICSPNYGPALDLLIEKIASKLRGNCLPRVLNPGDDGLVNCEVFELLPVDDEDDCPPEFGLEGDPIERELIEEGVPVKRKACKMKQLAVTGNNEIAAGNGWYYDNFSDDLKMDCNPGEQQRIAFSFANGNTTLPSGAGATFECFQPVARIDNDAKGFDAVNTRCSTGNPNDEICAGKSTEDYDLFCQADTLSCQITCENNPDCPPGWICQPPLSGDDIRSYCQLPTCPQDSSSNSGT